MEEVTIRLAQLVRWEAVGGSLCLTTLTSVLDLRHLPFDEFERFCSDLALWIAAQWRIRAAMPVISPFRLGLSPSLLKTEYFPLALPNPTSELMS
jgi:hypothetical protein